MKSWYLQKVDAAGDYVKQNKAKLRKTFHFMQSLDLNLCVFRACAHG